MTLASVGAASAGPGQISGPDDNNGQDGWHDRSCVGWRSSNMTGNGEFVVDWARNSDWGTTVSSEARGKCGIAG